jgi:4-hydroxy-2-oxoheptanedioate aldolase
MAEANRDLLTIIQIELAQAVELVSEIAAIEGVDGLYIGPADLSVELDSPGKRNAPPVIDAIRRTADACRESGKIMGCHVDGPGDVPPLRDMGVQMFGYACDISIYSAAIHRTLDDFRNVVK